MDKRKNNQIFFQYNSDKEHWEVRKSNSKRASAVSKTKENLEPKAIQIAKNQKLELNIKNKNGKISEKRSYGNDPFPPKDKK